MQVRRVYPDDITDEIHNRIYLNCIDLADTLTDNELTRHYDWLGAARYLTEHAAHGWLFFLEIHGEYVGLMCFSETSAPHLKCTCYVDVCLYVEPAYRSYRNVAYLIRESINQLDRSSGACLVFVGNTLASETLNLLYKRLGFSEIGSNLIKEIK